MTLMRLLFLFLLLVSLSQVSAQAGPKCGQEGDPTDWLRYGLTSYMVRHSAQHTQQTPPNYTVTRNKTRNEQTTHNYNTHAHSH